MSARQAIRQSVEIALEPPFHRKKKNAVIVGWSKFAAFGGEDRKITKSQRSDSRPLYLRSLSLTG